VRCRFAEIERFGQSGPAQGTQPITAFAEMGKRLNSIHEREWSELSTQLERDPPYPFGPLIFDS
jgi:hypothetical protein